MKNQGEVPRGNTPTPFGFVPLETVQEMTEVFILTNIQGRILIFLGETLEERHTDPGPPRT